jgi:pSer/pThr/pTyr-binding forkhead associated (FHA) protein
MTASSDFSKSSMPGNVFLVFENHLFPLNKSNTKIGRHPDNDLIINEPSVSRWHAELRFEDGEFYIYDMGSRFGTFVNTIKIKRSLVQNGDTISMANSPVLFIDRSDKIIRQIEQTTGTLILRDDEQ